MANIDFKLPKGFTAEDSESNESFDFKLPAGYKVEDVTSNRLAMKASVSGSQLDTPQPDESIDPEKAVTYNRRLLAKGDRIAQQGKDPRDGASNLTKYLYPTTPIGAATASSLEGAAIARGALAGGKAAMAVTPPVLPFIGPFGKPVAGVLGAIGGGMLASKGITSLESAADQVFGTNIATARQQQRQQQP